MLEEKELPEEDAQLRAESERALAEAARRAGERLACHAGCCQCCHGAFVLSALDALRLKAGLAELREHDPAGAEQVKARAKAWIARHGAEFPGERATGWLGTSAEEEERFEEFANEEPCPALEPGSGRCELYLWRPMTCRLFGPPVEVGEEGALAHCELCFQGATVEEVAACRLELPLALEERLTAALEEPRETVVAYALVG